MRTFILIPILLLATSSSAQSPVTPAMTDKLRDLYMERLDAWVTAGGDVKRVQQDVVTNCGKLMYLRDPSMGQSTSASLKETLDMRIDVCTKMTVHRVHPQPEFSNPAVLKITCGAMPAEEPSFAKLCASAKLKP